MRSRAIALITRDPALYADLAAVLRERRIPTVSLLPGDRIPARVAAVLTGPDEAEQIDHPCVLAVVPGADRSALWAAVEQSLDPQPTTRTAEIVVGFDPGPRPGYAVLAGGHLLAEGVLETPDDVGPFSSDLAARFPGRGIRFRVGSGDPPARNRMVRALESRHRSPEIVDERSTTPAVARRWRDAAAARAIARSPGRPVRSLPPVRATVGALRRIQHLSREGSGGRFTISRTLAQQVLDGELTLAEAVAAGSERYGPGASPTAGPNRDNGERVRRAWARPTSP